MNTPDELFPIIMLAAVTEFFLLMTWNRIYFRYGIPIFIKKYEIPELSNADEFFFNINYLEQNTDGGRFLPPLVFKNLAVNECAFREGFKLFRGRYTSLMHGIIRVYPEKREVCTTGYLNWSVLLLGVFFFQNSLTILPVILIILGVIYLIQVIRFHEAAGLVYEYVVRNDLVNRRKPRMMRKKKDSRSRSQ